MAMKRLPVAEEDKRSVGEWYARWDKFVAEVDFKPVREMFAEDVVAFGSKMEMMTSPHAQVSCPGIAVRRTASLRSPMTRASIRRRREDRSYDLNLSHVLMDPRVKPGGDSGGCGSTETQS